MSPTAAPHCCARCGAVVARGQRCGCRGAWADSTHPGGSRRWRRCRIAQLRVHPVCQWVGPDGTRCRAIAVEVDHVVALAFGGARWDPTNWTSLCHAHHVEKTTADAQHGRTRPRG
jgi:5-methylcytosine-specific restriction protein A